MKVLNVPRQIYVPVHLLPTTSYQAAIPPNHTWGEGDYGPNSAVFDTSSIMALDQLVAGPISTWDQLDAIELAIRAFVLHEKLYWIRPAILVVTPGNRPDGFAVLSSPQLGEDNASVLYPPPPQPVAVMDLLRGANADCYAVYSSWVFVSKGKVLEGDEFWREHYDKLRSASPPEAERIFRESFRANTYFRESYFASPKAIGAGTYFGTPSDRSFEYELMRARTARFAEDALRSIDDSWKSQISGASIGLNVCMGPFLTMVLSRANARTDIPNVVLELRSEFKKARFEFWQLLTEVLAEERLADSVRKIRKIESAVQSVIPAAFRSDQSLLSLIWGTTHAIADVAASGGLLSAIKFVGEILLNRDAHLAQASSIEITRMLVSELKSVDASIVGQLRKHLEVSELTSLGLSPGRI